MGNSITFKQSATIELVRSNSIFFAFLAYLFLGNLISDLWGYNEFTVLVYAKHFVDPSWIKKDWFLNLTIPYRYLFSSFSGLMALKMSIYMVEITGRIITFVILAYIFQRFARTFRMPWYLVICFLALFLAYPSVVAQEWIIGGFETKPFAYICLFLSLIYLIEKKYYRSFFFSGLALSFHILVGFYGSCCILGTFLINREHSFMNLKSMVRSIVLYVVPGSLGIYTIISVLAKSSNVDKKLAGLIYVTLRVPHHTLPSFWVKYRGGYSWVFALSAFLIFLLAVYLRKKSRKYRILTGFTLCSSIFFFIGLLIFGLNKLYLLKYYWFRLPDAILPLFSFFLFFALIGELIRKNYINFLNINFTALPQIIRILGISAALTLFVFAAGSFITTATAIHRDFNHFRYDTPDKELRKAMLWIRKNTSRDSTFLISPFIPSFYVVAQRAIFVSFKHVPASDYNILKWYKRLLLCNNNKNLSGEGFKGQSDAEFYNLNENYIRKLARTYHLDYYLGKAGKPLSFSRVYENASYALYKIGKDKK